MDGGHAHLGAAEPPSIITRIIASRMLEDTVFFLPLVSSATPVWIIRNGGNERWKRVSGLYVLIKVYLCTILETTGADIG